VCPNIYLTQRRDDLYCDPAEFRPERFAGHPAVGIGWFPFGGGIRRCLGATFATFEMRIVIPEVLHAVTLRPASPRPARIRRESVTFGPHDGAPCIVPAGSWLAAAGSVGAGLQRHAVEQLAAARLATGGDRLGTALGHRVDQPGRRGLRGTGQRLLRPAEHAKSGVLL